MDDLTTLSKRARTRRVELGYTQQEVAALINERGFVTVTRRDISRIETGELTTPHFVEELAIALEVSATWLASGMTPREHEQLLAGTLAAAGVATCGTLSDHTYSFEDEQETVNLTRLLLFMLGVVLGASIAVVWGAS